MKHISNTHFKIKNRGITMVGLAILLVLSSCNSAYISPANHLGDSSAMVMSPQHSCPEPPSLPCTINGKRGVKLCVNGKWKPCEYIEPPQTGTVRPMYMIWSVVYALPGTEGSPNSNSVTYGSGSTFGSTVSSSKSFKQNYSVELSASGSFILADTNVGVSFSYGRSSLNEQSIDIKKSTTTSTTIYGPSQNGIDHDRDQIWLWLNPVVQVTLHPSGKVSWKLIANPPLDIQIVHVGELKDPSRMPPGVAQRLQAYGITPQYYPQILNAYPFANGAPRFDQRPWRDRFQPLYTTIPYRPPYGPGDRVNSNQFKIDYSSTESSKINVTNDYSVGVTISGSQGFKDLFKASLKTTEKWTWTNTDTRSQSASTSETASMTITGPTYGYSGPTDFAVYYDVHYKTFLFEPLEGVVYALRGTVTSNSRRPVGGKEVTLVTKGAVYRTFSDTKGEFRFPIIISGRRVSNLSQLRVDSLIKQIPPQHERTSISQRPNIHIELP